MLLPHCIVICVANGKLLWQCFATLCFIFVWQMETTVAGVIVNVSDGIATLDGLFYSF